MAADTSWRMERRRPAEGDSCPLDCKILRVDGETGFSRLHRSRTGSSLEKRQQENRAPVSGDTIVIIEKTESSDDELGRLDMDLDRKSKQHNLTSSNVRAILHEVITNEHMVALMKATIRETQDLPMFEPKLTRSRLKQVIQQGQSLNTSLSAVNSSTLKPPQFVDIELEEDEDSSDEEYCPDEEEEDDEAEDMTEDTFSSDADSLASPPKTLRPPKRHEGQSTYGAQQSSPGLLGGQAMSSNYPPKPFVAAPEPSFLDRLNAVQEELDCNPASHQPLTYTCNQSLHSEADDDDEIDADEGSGGLACRTRSKLRLENVPLGQLEAKLLAPDITADMYEQGPVHRAEDRRWTKWLQGLMAPENEDEVDDEDDPEYNFLDDHDEPDMEDYRTDRAVQITKREVNELLDELFDTLQEEELLEEEKSECIPSQSGAKFNIPKALRFEAPLASMLTERRRTVREQYEAQQQKRALQDATNQHCNNIHLNQTPAPQDTPTTPVLLLSTCSPIHLDSIQKQQLQHQIQQHVQLLTQIHLLARPVDTLNHEACITKHYLEELLQFSRHKPAFLPSSFRVCNLHGALDLVQDVEQRKGLPPAPPAPVTSRRWLPRMTPATDSLAFPLLPADTAWLFATRSIFIYPELLPVCNLEAVGTRQQRNVYTAGEDGLIVLGLKHFEGTVEQDQLICSYLLRKTKWSLRKHVQEMSGPRAQQNNIIKVFLSQGNVPPLPLACSRVHPTDQLPPVDRNTPNMPNWLKNSQLIIQKTRLNSNTYPPSLPPGCTLRLHPHWLSKAAPRTPRHKRLFKLAHNASLLPLAKAPSDRQAHVQPISFLPPTPPSGVPIPSNSTTVSGMLAPPSSTEVLPLAATPTGFSQPASSNLPRSYVPIGQRIQRSVATETSSSVPLLLPLPSSYPDINSPIIPCSAAELKPGYFVVQVVSTSRATTKAQPVALHAAAPTNLPTVTSKHALGQKLHPSIKEQLSISLVEGIQDLDGAKCLSSTLTQSLSCAGEKEDEKKEEEDEENEEEKDDDKEDEDCNCPTLVTLNGEEKTGGEEEEARGGGGADGAGEEDASGVGEGEQGGEEEEEEEGQSQDGGGERDEDGEKDKDEDQDQQGDEEEEDFDDLTQDEDEEEVMSSASEESVLSVPELQETMKQLTWLAAERRLCADGDSEEDHSPTSPGSQEEEEEEEEEVPKEEESGEGMSTKGGEEEDLPSEGTPRRGGSRPVRGRGRNRPPRALRRSRQERHSIDSAKLLLLYDDNILDNDPYRESKDTAFANSYLSRVREALQDAPEQVEEFVSLLSKFEQAGEGQEVILLFRKLRCILGNRTDLLRDFAAFLHPEQALQCGLFEEQQAYERSRRFLRQLEISFGENPTQYQKIIKALQTGPDLSPASIHELKSQMATLLKGHTHLQNEFWVFFDELRPPPAHPGQFEEALWPEDGGVGSEGTEGFGQLSGGGPCSGFEEVTLPELEDEDDGQKIPPMTSQRQRRKLDVHRNYKVCDWSDKDWSCLCSDSKIRRHRRKGCPRCHGNKASGGVPRAMKRLGPLYSQIGSTHEDQSDKDSDLKGDNDSPQLVCSTASWEGSFPLIDEKDDEEEEENLEEDEDDDDEEERKNDEKEQSSAVKKSRKEENLHPSIISMNVCSSTTASTSSITAITFSMSISSHRPITPPPSSIISCLSNTSSTTPQASVTSSLTSQSSVASSMTSHPSVTSSITSQSSATSSITSKASVTSSISSQASVTSSIPTQPSVTSSIPTQPSVTSSIPTQPSVTSIPSQSSVASSMTSQHSVTSSITSQPSVTSSIPSQPSVTSSITSQPSVTSSNTSQPSVTSSITSQPSVTSSNTSQPSVTSSITSQPSVTSSNTSQPSVPSSVTFQPPVTSSITSQPSVTSITSQPSVTSITSQPSVTSIITSQPSVTSITSQPSVTSITSQASVTSITSKPSVASSITSQPSVTSSITSQHSVTSSITSQPSVTSSITSQPVATSHISTSTSVTSLVSSCTSSSSITSSKSPSGCISSVLSSSPPAPPRTGAPPDLPVCAKNMSLTASGEKVILWTREADRVILTTCQQEGANQKTFEAISALLGNKTPSEVSRRFRDLMRLFRTAARYSTSEEEALPTEPAATNEEED